MVSLQKESEWEKKWNDGIRPCAWDEVADFITAIVSTREKEIAEGVKKKATIHEIAVSNTETKSVKLVRLDDALSLINPTNPKS